MLVFYDFLNIHKHAYNVKNTCVQQSQVMLKK